MLPTSSGFISPAAHLLTPLNHNRSCGAPLSANGRPAAPGCGNATGGREATISGAPLQAQVLSRYQEQLPAALSRHLATLHNPAGKQVEGPEGSNLFIYHLPQVKKNKSRRSTFDIDRHNHHNRYNGKAGCIVGPLNLVDIWLRNFEKIAVTPCTILYRNQ